MRRMPRTTLRFSAPRMVSRIEIARGCRSKLGALTRPITPSRRVALVSEPRVAALYAGDALRSLARAGIAASLVTVPHGERAKSPRVLERLWRIFSELDLDRGAAIVALGGGVVGDLAGFAAATWLRGVPWVCVPTSLLSQVDSSVGGKTAVDLPAGKNLVGAFHQPALVIADPDVLATLPRRHLRAGLAEVVKTGMAVESSLFSWIERHLEPLGANDRGAWLEVVRRSVRAKARVVAADERESGPRTALNFGHTLGHALEAVSGFSMLHGEAVAIGMRVAGALSVREAKLPARDFQRLVALLEAFGLPDRIPDVPVDRLMEAMVQDKKRRNGRVRWVLTPRVGHASVPRLISGRLLEAALIEAGARA